MCNGVCVKCAPNVKCVMVCAKCAANVKYVMVCVQKRAPLLRVHGYSTG